ncbi:hypothetical protein JXM67_02655 [candidate division WOR-3 bacterium]|nr:hypothetical protein [candidate division WOR-3 bacterium]
MRRNVELKASSLALSLIMIFGAVLCESPGVHETLPLVFSIPGQFSPCSDYIGLTDSIAYVASLIESESGAYDVKLHRFSLSQPGIADSLILPLPPDLPSDRCFRFRYEISEFDSTENLRYLPHDGWIMLPFPLGDTTGMRRLGDLKTEMPPGDTRKTLIDRGENFYLVDIHSTPPRTQAEIRGLVIDVESPYLALYTGYCYTFEDGIPSRNVKAGAPVLLVIDLSRAEVVLRVGVTDSSTGFPPNALLTVDGRFFYAQGEPRETDWRKDEICPTERWKVYFWNLVHSEKETVVLNTPVHSLTPSIRSFLSDSGKVFFLGDKMSWGMAPDLSFEYPAVSDFANPPYEARWLGRFTPPCTRMDWRLSPEKRWLVLDVYRQRVREAPFYSTIVPVGALTDSSLAYSRDLLVLPQGLMRKLLYKVNLSFMPGEEKALVNYSPRNYRNYIAFKLMPSPELRPCSGQGVSYSLYAAGESGRGEAFFSPEGRYVTYICSMDGKDGFFLQVRRLPD